ncbi:hypothetical protein Kpho02_37320 [Kitasatospora phosalacinea]|uniref:Uncharacterized protein n=1 Tax=Kitasatospora phosalacinea TaxID=2065 RepID=A0A9W6V2N7_9ACTN|nr:hypothetical protein Kpho02_37320 [Kitasatospora phosalacinea]
MTPGDGTWNAPDDHVAWRSVCNAMLEEQVVTLEGGCPVCGTGRLQLAFTIDGPERRWVERGVAMCGTGRYWEWCEQCRSYEYYCRSSVPEWARTHIVAESEGWRDPRQAARLIGA